MGIKKGEGDLHAYIIEACRVKACSREEMASSAWCSVSFDAILFGARPSRERCRWPFEAAAAPSTCSELDDARLARGVAAVEGLVMNAGRQMAS